MRTALEVAVDTILENLSQNDNPKDSHYDMVHSSGLPMLLGSSFTFVHYDNGLPSGCSSKRKGYIVLTEIGFEFVQTRQAVIKELKLSLTAYNHLELSRN